MEIEHWSHQHPLTLCNHTTQTPDQPQPEQAAPPPLRSHGCSRSINSSEQFYACKTCNFRLHKPCADLPSDRLHHPYHPSHPLTIKVASWSHSCTFCRSYILGFNLCCNPCGFYLDSHCATNHSTTKYEDSGHLFFLVEAELYTYYPCDVCGDDGWDTHLFRCVVPGCSQLVHFHCAPLPFPGKFESACHVHSLTLERHYVQQWTDVQYCDVCEKMRNPKHPVYCCIECGFVAHISCTIEEVLPSIIVEHEKDAKLREDLEHNPGLHKIRTQIWDARGEENRLVAELEKIRARLDILKTDRAHYISSSISSVPDSAESSDAARRPSA